MTQYVCIPQSKNNDPNYRYKMPLMKLRQESRLNGAKMNITNLPDVARALRVPDSAILKFFCVDKGANSEGESIIKGVHTVEDLCKSLEKFIHKYVLCSKCKLPEITHTVDKKNLIGTCRSCGRVDKNMDCTHKAGKQLKNDIATYYQANPEFGSAPNIGASLEDSMPSGKAGKHKKKGKKGSKREAENAAAAAQQAEEEKEKLLQEKAAKLKATGGEVSRLDATVITLDDSSIVNACDELKAFIDEKGAEEIKNNEIMQQVRHTQLQLNITPDYKFYICLVAIFGPQRNIVKHWDTFEAIFTSMAEQDEENGNKHLFQAIIQFFINKYPDQQKYAMAFCKKLWDNSIFDDEFFIKWHSRKLKLDKDSGLNDKSAEKAMRELITPFVVDWLQTAEYDDETGYGEEEDAQAQEEEEKKEEEPEETEAEKNQRLMIEAQKKAQAQLLADAMSKGAQKAEQAQAQAEADAANLEQVAEAKNVAKIEVADEFDIDDI